MLRLIVPLLLAGGATALVLSAGSIRISPYDPVGGRLFPQSVAVAMLVLALLHLGLEVGRMLRRSGGSPASAAAADASQMPVARALLVIGLFALAVGLVAVHAIGLIAAIALVVVVGSLVLAPRDGGWRGLARQGAAALLAAGLLFALSQLLVVQTLGIRLP